MNILKHTSPTEQKLKKVEDLMRELNLSLSIEFHNFVVMDGNEKFPMVEVESGGRVTTFPRTFESERLQKNEIELR